MHDHSESQHHSNSEEWLMSVATRQSLFALIIAAMAATPSAASDPQGRWAISKDGAVLTCRVDRNKPLVTVSDIFTHAPRESPLLKKSRRAFTSSDKSAAAVFDFNNGTTTARYYAGCSLVQSAAIPGLEIFGVVHVHSEYGMIGAFVAPPTADDLRDEYPARKGALIYFGATGGTQTLGTINYVEALDTNYELTKNKRYAKVSILGTLHFVDLKTGSNYAHTPTSKFRGATLTESGKVILHHLKRIERLDGSPISEKELNDLYHRIGAKAYELRREIVDVTDEHQL